MRITGIIVLLLLWCGVASATQIQVCTDKVQLDGRSAHSTSTRSAAR
jgi:hypothetical protein